MARVCRVRAVWVPPGANRPHEAPTKVTAMAKTGAPNNLPTAVVFPNVCARTLIPAKAATFPHTVSAPIRLIVLVPVVLNNNRDDDEVISE